MSQVKLTTNHGAITLKLDAERPRKRFANFILPSKPATNGTIFHRVIKNFMIQGRRHEPEGMPGSIENEPPTA